MENILIRFFQEIHQVTPAEIAQQLDITVSQYMEIETGEAMLTARQARQLGKLFKVKGQYFYDAALQLDILLTKKEIIKIQKEKISQLEQHLRKLQRPNQKRKKLRIEDK